MAATKTTHQVTVHVTADSTLSRDEAVRLLKRVIECGEAEALAAPKDWDDPDLDKINSMAFLIKE